MIKTLQFFSRILNHRNDSKSYIESKAVFTNLFQAKDHFNVRNILTDRPVWGWRVRLIF